MRMKNLLAVLAGFSVCLAATTATAQLSNPLIVNVNCNSGGVIQNEIDNATISRPVEIVVTGPCTENLVIARDQVTIRSATAGRQTLNGNVTVSNADRVTIDGFNIKRVPGPATWGIMAKNDASVKLENIVATGHRGNTLAVTRNATVRANLVTLIGTSISSETIVVADGGYLRFERSRAQASNQNDGASALGLYRNATAKLQYNARLIHTNPSASDEYAGAAVVALEGSVLRIQADGTVNTITGNVAISDAATADIRNTNLTGNVISNRMSLVEFRSSTTIVGDVRAGTRSLIDFRFSPMTGAINCYSDGAVRRVPAGITPNVNCVVY